MAQQIKKKFIKSDAIDGSKILLEADQTLRKKDGLGGEIDVLQSLKDYTDQKVSAIVDTAPEVLDTLNELAAALGDDPNFATTISAQIGSVDSKVDQEILDRQAGDSALDARVSALEEKHPIDLANDVQNILPVANGGTGTNYIGPKEILFGSPDGLAIDRSEFLTYDASIGLLINQGGQMQTRSLEQGANDPSSVIINDKVEVVVDDVDGPAYTRMRKDYIEAKKVLSNKELSASMGFDGTDSWVGVSKTENAGNNISMIKLFPEKAQLFTVDLGAGTGPQPTMPVENYDLVVKKYVDDEVTAEEVARQNADTALSNRISTLEGFGYDQVVYVSKNGLDTNSGKQHSPFLTITAAMNSISDASPSKRYAVKVMPGSYTEASLALKANVFIVGEGNKESIRITGSASLGPSFTANSSFDHRSGFHRVTLLSAANFDWNAVQSAAGKLYISETVFGSTLTMNGYNNAIAQAQFNECVIFGNVTISGINVGVFTDNVCFGNITLNQHPNGGMATILTATGGYCSGTVRQTTTVNDFNRRCASFLRGFTSENLIVDGPASYADVDLTSQSKQGAQKLNGGNLIALNPIIAHDLTTQMIVPRTTNSHNMGDWGKQWTWNFGYVHASTGTDLFLISYPESYAPDSAGKSIGIYTDGAGLQDNVNGGEIVLETATTTGTGVRGKIQLNGREIDVTSKKVTNLADGTVATDAVNKGQLDAAVLVEQLARQAADSALDSRISALEGQIDGPTFFKMKIVIDESSELSYVDLDHTAIANSLVVAVGRLMAHMDEDFTVSIVGGKTRLTWTGAFAAGGEEAIDLSDVIFVTYAVDA